MERIILDFAKEFKRLRHTLGETQQGLSDITGIPKQTIANWECNKYAPPTWSQVLIINMLEDLIEENIEAELYKEAIKEQELCNRELLYPY